MSVPQENRSKSRFRKFIERADKWFDCKDLGKWLKEMKTSINLTLSIIATVTFSLGMNPPGGVVQAGLDDFKDLKITKCLNRTIVVDNMSMNRTICIGEALMASLQHDKYLLFLAFNTTCFISSISVILFVVSGIPFNKPRLVWILSGGMSITLTFLALTYLMAANMVTPNSIWNSPTSNVFGIALIVWSVVALIGHGFLIFRFTVKGVMKILRQKR